MSLGQQLGGLLGGMPIAQQQLGGIQQLMPAPPPTVQMMPAIRVTLENLQRIEKLLTAALENLRGPVPTSQSDGGPPNCITAVCGQLATVSANCTTKAEELLSILNLQ